VNDRDLFLSTLTIGETRKGVEGGVADQAAWVVDAFGVLTGASARWDEAERKRGRAA